MEVRQVMKTRVVSVDEGARLEDAIRTFVENKVGLLPIVDAGGKLIGVLSLQHVLSLSWPSFVEMIEDIDFVHDFGAMESVEISAEMRRRPVSELMVEPIAVPGTCRLMRAATIMNHHDIRDLPIVDDDEVLIGLASWVDVGVSFLKGWSDLD